MAVDLTTNWLGIPLKHPVVASASPLSHSLEGIRELADHGAAAVVMFSLFEEQLRQEQAAFDDLSAAGSHSTSEAGGYFPDLGRSEPGPDAYLNLIRRARTFLKVPLIASLNGMTDRGWCDYAARIADAGADALELNIFWIPADARQTGRDVEDRYVNIVQRVTKTVSIPVAVKLSPWFSATGEMAGRLFAAGAAGLVLFNRFYLPDFDLERLEVQPSLQLSSAAEMRLPLLWLSLLSGKSAGSLGASTGVETSVEVIKYLLAGADVVMTASALLRHGPAWLRSLVDGLEHWMVQRGYHSVQQLRGAMNQQHARDPDAFVRSNYVRLLSSWRNPAVSGHGLTNAEDQSALPERHHRAF